MPGSIYKLSFVYIKAETIKLQMPKRLRPYILIIHWITRTIWFHFKRFLLHNCPTFCKEILLFHETFAFFWHISSSLMLLSQDSRRYFARKWLFYTYLTTKVWVSQPHICDRMFKEIEWTGYVWTWTLLRKFTKLKFIESLKKAWFFLITTHTTY